MTITLIGMPAVGKSYMGKSIAKKFNMKLVDGDKVIVKTDGRPLQQIMDEDGIDKSVVLSIATKPEQERNVNNFAISLLDNDRIIPFGSVFPGSDTAMDELERLKNAGIKGIKLHPEYQQFYIDDENAIKVFNKCAELGLLVLLHCGADVAFDPPVHADPERIEKVAKLCPDTIFICAHMGGYNMWQEFSSKVTAHSNLYIDTSMTGTVAILDTETARRIIDIHGADKFLFGSDMPWERQSRSVDKLLSFGLSESDADCTVRMSLCKDNTREDIDVFAELLASGINRLVKIKR